MTEHTNGPMMGALPPPPVITPDFVDPPSIQGGIVAVLVVSLTVSTLCIGLRTATRLANRFANAGWDDCECFQLARACFVFSHPFGYVLLTLLVDISFFAWVEWRRRRLA